MMYFCDIPCEHDTNIPHFAIIAESGKARTVILMCSICRHALFLKHPDCLCRAGCHSEARYGSPEGLSITAK